MGIKDWTISTRFFVTMGHFTALLILYSTYEANVNLGLSDNATSTDRFDAKRTALAAIIFATFCFAFDFIGIFFGTSLFFPMVNMIQIFFHFVGSIFLSWVITENWNYRAFWPIVATCNIPTALMEIGILLFVHGFRIYKP